MRFRDIIKWPSSIGLFFGAILMALSVTPSLIPRTPVQQAAISAITFFCGYGFGVGLNALWRYLGLPRVSEQKQRTVTLIMLAIAGAILLFFFYRSLAWQNSTREVVSLEPVDSTYPIITLLLALAIAAILLIIFRFLWWIAAVVLRFVTRFIPNRYGQVLGVIAAVAAVAILVNGLFLDWVTDAMNASYALSDSSNYDNVEPPASSLRSGSPESSIPWETLGREGRRFVGTGPTQEEISAIADDGTAAEPIRIYVGSKSGETPQERAELALEELIRTGAFDRDLLMLVTTTGNGWTDSNAIDTLEYLHGGDTATLAFQYSYLPSTFSLLADKDASKIESTAMFNAVHQYWQTLDPEERPNLFLFGLSLGAYGSQAAVSNVNVLNDPIDGALWAGPPFVSEFWRQLTRDRDSGTPVWRPIYDSGTTIRFSNLGEGLNPEADDWKDNRFIYLQQAGDPIVFFRADSLYREPEWLKDESRSPKAPPEMTWFPVVTFWQTMFDMVLGTSDTLPDGNGHRYGSGSYIDSWMALTQPEDWTDAEVEEFKEWFSSQGNPNKP